MSKKPFRLIEIIGKTKLFFSFDPLFEQCTRCRWKKARHVVDRYVDGGSRRAMTQKLCKKCYVKHED